MSVVGNNETRVMCSVHISRKSYGLRENSAEVEVVGRENCCTLRACITRTAYGSVLCSRTCGTNLSHNAMQWMWPPPQRSARPCAGMQICVGSTYDLPLSSVFNRVYVVLLVWERCPVSGENKDRNPTPAVVNLQDSGP
jgi:hypothetical protein